MLVCEGQLKASWHRCCGVGGVAGIVCWCLASNLKRFSVLARVLQVAAGLPHGVTAKPLQFGFHTRAFYRLVCVFVCVCVCYT